MLGSIGDNKYSYSTPCPGTSYLGGMLVPWTFYQPLVTVSHLPSTPPSEKPIIFYANSSLLAPTHSFLNDYNQLRPGKVISGQGSFMLTFDCLKVGPIWLENSLSLIPDYFIISPITSLGNFFIMAETLG